VSHPAGKQIMTKTTKRELLAVIKTRYLKAKKRSEKTAILDEFCKSTGYHRRSAVRIMRAGHGYASAMSRKRHRRYGSVFMVLVIKLWELLEYPCGTRLKPQLVPLAEALVRSKEITVSDEDITQLRTISAKTLDRRLKREREIRRLHRNRGMTRHGSLVKSAIPIRITDWDTKDIGFMEMDTVAHNGGDPSGTFIYSLDMVEIATGWSEQMAIVGKSEEAVVDAITTIRAELPFALKGLDSDSGGEFVNWHMVRYCEKEKLFFTRSRPNKKNDNAYVEQKNYTHIRKWMGYRRYDMPEQRDLMNDLYRQELRLFNNFFRPVMKILRKEKLNNSICKKTYGEALTPYQRLMQAKSIPPETKAVLRKLYESLNPVKLKAAIEAKLKRIQKS
jgi:hypothetical protein